MKIKKIIILVSIMFLLVGCGKANENSGNSNGGNGGSVVAGEVTKENFMNFPTTAESEFRVDYDESGAIINGCSSDDKVIKVPETINGRKVVGIASYSLSNLENVEAIVLPDSVLWIGENAFTIDENLKYIYLGKSLKSIGKMAFNYNIKLEEVIFPEGMEKINIPFCDCYELKKVYIPSSVTDIEVGISFGCSKLTIYTPSGSLAEAQAKKENTPVVNE